MPFSRMNSDTAFRRERYKSKMLEKMKIRFRTRKKMRSLS